MCDKDVKITSRTFIVSLLVYAALCFILLFVNIPDNLSVILIIGFMMFQLYLYRDLFIHT